MDEDGKKSKKTSTYVYDLLGRITKETKTGSEDISYTYDSNNNRKETTVGNKVTAYKYNKNDELLRTDTLNTDTEGRCRCHLQKRQERKSACHSQPL